LADRRTLAADPQFARRGLLKKGHSAWEENRQEWIDSKAQQAHEALIGQARIGHSSFVIGHSSFVIGHSSLVIRHWSLLSLPR
jgi:hypothetical protein